MNNVKCILVCFFLLCTATAGIAKEIIVFDEEIDWKENLELSAEIKISSKQQLYVNVSIFDPYFWCKTDNLGDSCSRRIFIRKSVDQLKFDKESNQAYFQDDELNIVCGGFETEEFLFFSYEKFVSNGNCEFTYKQEWRDVDDGTEINVARFGRVTLIVKELQ